MIKFSFVFRSEWLLPSEPRVPNVLLQLRLLLPDPGDCVPHSLLRHPQDHPVPREDSQPAHGTHATLVRAQQQLPKPTPQSEHRTQPQNVVSHGLGQSRDELHRKQIFECASVCEDPQHAQMWESVQQQRHRNPRRRRQSSQTVESQKGLNTFDSPTLHYITSPAPGCVLIWIPKQAILVSTRSANRNPITNTSYWIPIVFWQEIKKLKYFINAQHMKNQANVCLQNC